jgi:hypothetical protein
LTRSRGLGAAPTLIILYTLSRGLLLAAGLFGLAHIPSGKALQGGNVQRGWSGPAPLEIWARWDSEWYLLIAERGYHLEDQMAGRRVAYEAADATGFFPLYPILVRSLAVGLDGVPAVRAMNAAVTGRSPEGGPGGGALLLSGVLISNAALVASLFLLHDRAREGLHPREGGAPEVSPERAALFACAALLLFPPSLFLSAVYAESLLLLLSLLVFRFLKERRWLAAAIAGGLASATKPTGLLLLIPAALTVARSRVSDPGAPRASSLRGWMTLPLYPAGAALFSLYCARAFGDPLAWLHRQDRWRGAVSGPWRAFTRWAEHPVIHGSHGSTVELIFAILILSLLVTAIRSRPPAESIFAGSVLVPPLCSTLWSYGRLSLQAFPAFIALGRALARRRWAAVLYVTLAAAGSAILMAYFGAWYWAG